MELQVKRYNTVAIILHWATALLIITLLALGSFMVNVKLDFSTKISLYQLHKSLGFCVLFLSILRLMWRLNHRPPALPNELRPWEKYLAKATHILFYVLLIALPLSGWIRVSGATFNIPTLWFGTIPIPHIPYFEMLSPAEKKSLEPVAQTTHFGLALSMAGLLALHIAGALKHHFIDGQSIIHRMSPFK